LDKGQREDAPLSRSSYDEALANHEAPHTRWPRDEASQQVRLDPFCQPALAPTFKIGREDLVFTIGSCFARNIEEHLISAGFDVAVQRFEGICQDLGVKVKSNTLNKFVIQSIVNELRWALEPGAKFPLGSIVEVKDGRFLDMQLAPGLLPTAHDTAVRVRRAISDYMRLVKDAKVVIVTLGLAEAWFDAELGLYTNTTPLPATARRYPGRFEHHLLEYNQLLGSLREMLRLLETYGHRDFRMILTVSPVAMGSTFTDRDALVANSYSKAVQRAAVEALCRENSRVDYLPTYESVTLSQPSLAWREDRAHVSTEIVRLNVLRMQKAYTDVGQRREDASVVSGAEVEALKLAQEAVQLFKAGEAERADDLFARAVHAAPGEVLPRVQWGETLYKRQRWAEAAEQLQMATKLGAKGYNIAYVLGKSLAKLGQWAAVEAAALVAVEEEPEQPGPQKLLAKARKELHRGGRSGAPVVEVAAAAFDGN
jgi:tetratricopeptide (TPR) repeat protein